MCLLIQQFCDFSKSLKSNALNSWRVCALNNGIILSKMSDNFTIVNSTASLEFWNLPQLKYLEIKSRRALSLLYWDILNLNWVWLPNLYLVFCTIAHWKHPSVNPANQWGFIF